MSSLFPVDIITEILVWLPVKDLIRFKCLSKLFSSIIDCPNFIKMHLSRAIHTNTRLKIINFLYYDSEFSDNSDNLDCPHDIFAVDVNNGLQQVVDLTNPFKSKHCSTLFCGSSCGLLLLYNHDKMVIWNPFTRRYRKLPSCPFETPAICSLQADYLRFGYDSTRDDYKVVSIWTEIGVDFPKQVWVYSLTSDCWKRVNDFSFGGYNVYREDQSIHSDDVLTWRCCKGGEEEIIIAFDVATESFSEIHMPVCSPKHEAMKVNPWLDGLGGCLYINSEIMESEQVVSFKCYILKKDEGGQFSWSQLFKVNGTKVGVEQLKPLAHLKEGHKVLLSLNDGEDIAWYDTELKSWEWVEIDGFPYWLDSIACWESLVSLGENSEFDGRIHRKPALKKKKKAIR